MSGQDLLGCWLAVVVSDDRGHVLVARWDDTQAWDLPVGLLHRGEDVLAGAAASDAVEMCAAVYALPDQFRERGRSGTPLLWPWPWELFQNGLSRREELLLGAAMLLIAAERLDHQVPGREQRHLQAVSATVPEVGQQ